MKITIKSLTVASVLLTSLLFAVNPPTGDPGDCSTESECPDCEPNATCSADGGYSSSSGSLSKSINVGKVREERSGNFLSYSRLGAVEPNRQTSDMPDDFDSVLSRIYSGGSLNRRSLFLRLDSDKIDASLADPKSLTIERHGNTANIIDRDGAIRQIVTDTALTDISPIQDGFQVRVWSLRQIILTLNNDGLYDLPDPVQVSPLLDLTHTYNDSTNVLTSTQIEYQGDSPRTTTSTYLQTTSPDRLVVECFDGATATGSPYKRETLDYSNRGARIWDYTVDRKIELASVSGQTGALGPLQTVSQTREVYQDFSLNSQDGGLPGARRHSRAA